MPPCATLGVCVRRWPLVQLGARALLAHLAALADSAKTKKCNKKNCLETPRTRRNPQILLRHTHPCTAVALLRVRARAWRVFRCRCSNKTGHKISFFALVLTASAPTDAVAAAPHHRRLLGDGHRQQIAVRYLNRLEFFRAAPRTTRAVGTHVLCDTLCAREKSHGRSIGVF